MRPCFCCSAHFAPNGLCPVHDFWPLASVISPSEFATPALQGQNLNRILKALLAKLDIEGAVRYSTHCFRGAQRWNC